VEDAPWVKNPSSKQIITVRLKLHSLEAVIVSLRVKDRSIQILMHDHLYQANMKQ